MLPHYYKATANLAYEPSMEELEINHARGYFSKEDFATTPCAHQAAPDATKCPQRNAAEIWRKQQRWKELEGKEPSSCSRQEIMLCCVIRPNKITKQK